ncbi:MAG TPA: GNAT family protein [Marmoricola sp.]|nr:GNAT family protein [Marmoricola sp.]
MTLRAAFGQDAEALAALMRRNREFFRTGGPARDADDPFFTAAGQREVIERAEANAEADTGRMFLVEVEGELVGRVNLNSIIRGAFQSASVGYMVDEAWTGRGVATAALRALIAVAFGELDLHRLQGETLTTNIASQRVLERCGFSRYGRAPDYLFIGGRWQTHDLFQLVNPDHRGPR